MTRSKVQLDKDGYRILTKEQRQKVYARALQTFKNHAAEVEKTASQHYNAMCNGMCEHIDNAVRYYRFDRNVSVNTHTKVGLPEYHSFKPKTGWKENTSFWITRRIAAGGHTKRIAILEACAAGKKKGE